MLCVFSSPIRFHVLPASIVLKIPSPKFSELRGLPSPVPTQTTEGLFCWTAMEPMFSVGCSSNTEVQLAPALVVFHTPPDAAPTYQVSWLLFTTSMAVIRPLIPAGPMLRSL